MFDKLTNLINHKKKNVFDCLHSLYQLWQENVFLRSCPPGLPAKTNIQRLAYVDLALATNGPMGSVSHSNSEVIIYR